MKANRFRFRAWNKDSNTMIDGKNYGIHGLTTDETGLIDGVENHSLSGSSAGLAENIIIMQSTGLVDKNGVEIFEGDILSASVDIKGQFVFKGIVKWDKDGCWCFEEGSDNVLWELISNYHHLEVIGNIYEHPALMETK